MEGAALAGVNSSTLGGRVGARRRIGVLVAAGTVQVKVGEELILARLLR